MKKIYILSLFMFCYVASFAQKFDEQVKSLTESIYDKVTVDPRKADSCLAVIEGCIANARVEGSGETVGGGIVGKAVGRVSGNTFNYGITLLQEATNFKSA